MKYKISEFSSISGVTASNIRYYEQRGLPAAIRSESGYRQYQIEDSYQINTFNELLAHGFSISEAIALLNGRPAKELADCLKSKNLEIEEQILLLQKKQEWNNTIQRVLEKLEEELKTIHVLQLPDLCYLKCTEGYDQSPSLTNDNLMARWVELLPFCHYAQRTWTDGAFTLGMIMELRDAGKYGLDGEGTQIIPGGEFYTMLLRGEDAERDLKDDKRILALLQDGYQPPESFFHVYLMFPIEEYGSNLNYVFFRKSGNSP